MGENQKQTTGFQTSMASEFLVMSMLYRLGLNAHLTLGNNKRVDIIVETDDDKMVTIDVKSVRRTDSIPVGNVKAKENHYVVAVIYKNKFNDVTALPDFYIVPSKVVAEKAVVYATGPTDLFTKDIVEYKGKWEELKCKK